MPEAIKSQLNQALARKWRPVDFNQVIGQTQTLQALSNALTHQRLHHAYLFTGTRGVGKTTIARILAKCLNCETGITATPCGQCSACTEIDSGRFPDLYEIDAASRTKVEDTRELLDNAQYAAVKGRYKIYLIDEVHMLSGHSFNALLKTLEEPPEHVKFILATTDPQKLPATVLSRCLQFHLHLLTVEQITAHLSTITQAEQISATTDALPLIAKAANGSMRDALSLLDQAIAFCNNALDADKVRNMIGSIAPELLIKIIEALADNQGDQLMAQIHELQKLGCDFSQVLAELLSTLHHIACEQVVPGAQTDSNNPAIKPLAEKIPAETIQLYYQIGCHGQRDLPFTPTAQSGFEMTLLRMLAFTPATAATTTSTGMQKSRTTAAAPIDSNVDWPTLCQQLQLTGTASLLAQQCSEESRSDSTLSLVVNSNQQPLIQANNIKRIQEAVQKALQKPIQVTVKVGQVTNQTPADKKASQAQEKQDQARQAIYSDGHVQDIIKAFDATIIEDSIAPTDNNHQ